VPAEGVRLTAFGSCEEAADSVERIVSGVQGGAEAVEELHRIGGANLCQLVLEEKQCVEGKLVDAVAA